MFDKQIDRITEEIDKMLEHLKKMQPKRRVVGILVLHSVNLSSKTGANGCAIVEACSLRWFRVFKICTI